MVRHDGGEAGQSRIYVADLIRRENGEPPYLCLVRPPKQEKSTWWHRWLRGPEEVEIVDELELRRQARRAAGY
ncbi:MAG TPA: hypothetical protein VJ914_19030 [Pseudonocardiaceae bacterium]|nr:hypothetical protein [Pseudonocardiaceae bacterium]